MGAGAISQVIYEIGRLMLRETEGQPMGVLIPTGLIAGLLIMYLTGLFVVG